MVLKKPYKAWIVRTATSTIGSRLRNLSQKSPLTILGGRNLTGYYNNGLNRY